MLGFKFNIVWAAAIIMALWLVAPASALDVDMGNAAFARTAGKTSIPVGHAEFCAKRPDECAMNASVVDVMPLTAEAWHLLLQVNTALNAAIQPAEDKDLYNVAEYWTYPNGYGDCEDYVLAKRRALIELGWPASTLLITVVRQRNGEGHAVLMVRTDRGDLILDNQNALVEVWNATSYQFLKRQSQMNAGEWVDIVDDRPTIIAAGF